MMTADHILVKKTYFGNNNQHIQSRLQ